MGREAAGWEGERKRGKSWLRSEPGKRAEFCERGKAKFLSADWL